MRVLLNFPNRNSSNHDITYTFGPVYIKRRRAVVLLLKDNDECWDVACENAEKS